MSPRSRRSSVPGGYQGTRVRPIALAQAIWLSLFAGCLHSAPRLNPPAIDAAAAGQQAVSDFDKNSDGAIDKDELAAVPGLAAGVPSLSAGEPPRVTADAITARIGSWQTQKIALTKITLKFTLDGKPLSGAQVTLIPEKFLGANVATASGTTDDAGFVSPVGPPVEANGAKFHGINYGYFRVEVSKKENGAEIIPERYNAQTELGAEVAGDLPVMQTGITFNLKSK